MDTVNDRRTEDCPEGQKSANIHRRANKGSRHEARVWNLEQTASDYRSVAQTRGGTPDRDAALTATRKQRLGASELFWPKVYIAT